MANVRRVEYTQREYAKMHYLYGLCDGNARAAAGEYRQRYPDRGRFPDYKVQGIRYTMRTRKITCLVNIILEMVVVGLHDDDQVEEQVLRELENDPTPS